MTTGFLVLVRSGVYSAPNKIGSRLISLLTPVRATLVIVSDAALRLFASTL